MAIFDIFKKKKKKKPRKVEKPKEKPKEKAEKKITTRPPRPAAKRAPEVPTQPSKERRRERKVAPLILKSVHITEKATDLTKDNQYVFKVFPQAAKQEIKKAVEEVYGVEVVRVRTIKVRRKRRRLGRSFGWRKGYKKAIVTLRAGQKIEILPR